VKRAAPLILLLVAFRAGASEILVGSKRFTESYVLAEIAARSLSKAGIASGLRPGMGGTIILWEALKAGSIAVYPEYTGTIREEILKDPAVRTHAEIVAALAPSGVGITESLGFSDTYSLVMRKDRAEALGISAISDLARHPELSAGFTHEFLGRRDGWLPLAKEYGISLRNVRGIDHAIGYAALASGAIDVKDAYSTDARLSRADLVSLNDDRRFFPEYEAVFLYRLDLDARASAVLGSLAGKIDAPGMRRLNSEAELRRDYGAGAALFFGSREAATAPGETAVQMVLRCTRRHLFLVAVSLSVAVLIGIPLGILASRKRAAGAAILGAVGIVQTIPSLALLALLVPIPFFGIRAVTALSALFLYSLLPIVRNTATGLLGIEPTLKESIEVLALSPVTRLFRIELPLASRSILAGIRTSAVIDIGNATLAALIGAGGLGEPIVSGLNLNDHRTILLGAVPAAGLAILAEILFAAIERIAVPRGIRLSAGR
jgi:osmoprotectant transport system permease protein